MRFKEIEDAVERNILILFKIFYENPAFFLCETDVESYLYSLLINDPVFKQLTLKFHNELLKKDSKTLLVHTEIPLQITKRKTSMYDISIWNPLKIVNMNDWETMIGIEVKFNRRYPKITKDLEKVKVERRGYVLWLNWDRPISEKILKKAKAFVKKYRNLKLYYLDVFSDPIKTNVKIV